MKQIIQILEKLRETDHWWADYDFVYWYNEAISDAIREIELIMPKESTMEVWDWDNSYNIPVSRKDEFYKHVDERPTDDMSEEFFVYCEEFDENWWEYQI